MKHFLRSLAFLSYIISGHFITFGQEIDIQKHPFNIGETFSFYSSILGQTPTINVYLPTAYSPDSLRQYPVIYLLDGSADEDFIHISGLVQFGSFSWINMIPETIVVGISTIDRKHDFTFPTHNTKDKEEFPTTGGSENFIHFLGSELQPLIDAEYKTNSEKILIGQSLGGLLATEILLKKPELFTHYIIVSPSLWWDDESLLETELPALSENTAIYIGVGNEVKIMVKDARKLYKKVKSNAANPSNVYFNYFKAQTHGDILHLAVYDAFLKLFASWTNKNH